MTIIDISIPLSNETPVWENDKGITITQVDFAGKGGDFNVSRLEMGVHAGTHIDSPFHLINNGKTIDQIPLENMIGRAQVVEIPTIESVIDEQYLRTIDFQAGIERILFKTSNSRYWETDPYSFNKEYVALNSSGARFLANLPIRLVGLDYFSISLFEDLIKPHEILLSKGVVLLENIDLRRVNPGIYKLICLPLKLTGTDGAPARAVLLEEKF